MKNTDGFGVPVMTDQRFGYVKVEEYDALAREVESMRGTILALSVARAERDQYKARLAEATELLARADDDLGEWERIHGDDPQTTRLRLEIMGFRAADSATERQGGVCETCGTPLWPFLQCARCVMDHPDSASVEGEK